MIYIYVYVIMPMPLSLFEPRLDVYKAIDFCWNW